MFTFRVLPDSGEPYELVARSRDVVTWEKGGRGRSLGKFAENPAMGDLYALAHAAALRQGQFAGPLTEFEQSVDVELIGETDADPTRTAR